MPNTVYYEKVISHTNMGRQEAPCKLGRSTPWYATSNSNGWAAVALTASECWTLLKADGSSLNQQWFALELTLNNIHSLATWCRWHNDKQLWSGQNLATECTGAREAEDDIQQLIPTPENNTQGLGEQMHSSNEVTKTKRYPQIHISCYLNTELVFLIKVYLII